jgi:hypothetical protein
MIPRSPRTRAALVAFLLALPLYLATMNRTVGFNDRGELAAAAHGFGIPHATGYPTLMLLGGALARLLPLPPILTLNALAALLAAASALALVALVDRVLAAVTAIAAAARATLALAAALFAATTATWWQQATGFEVYALHALALPVVALLGLRWLETESAAPGNASSPASRRAGFAFALVLGLAFTNHLTVALLLPGLLAAAIARLGFGAPLGLRLLRLLPGFLLGLLPYLWLPIRSAMEPALDWGDPETPWALLRHVTGGEYRGWLFAEASTVAFQARYLLGRVPWDLGWAGVPVCGLGLALLLRRSPGLGAMTLGFGLAALLFAAGYRVPDPDAYLLAAVLAAALALAAGLARLHERFGARVALPIAALLLLANLGLHCRESDERGNRLVESFVVDLLGPLPERAVLFTAGWEIAESAALYFQQVEGFRSDVLTVSLALSGRSWYLDQLERRAPELCARARAPLAGYRDRLRALERGAPVPRADLREARARFLDALVEAAQAERPVLAMTSLPEAGPRWTRVPWHLAIRLAPDTGYVAEPEWGYAYRPWNGRLDLYSTQACWAYGTARLARAGYEARHGRGARAGALVAQAASFDPGIRPDVVAPLPLGADAQVLRTARFFQELRAGAGPVAVR